MGLLDHPPQLTAFTLLIAKFIQDEANKARNRPSNLSVAETIMLAQGFMEEYEQRLWPRELDHPGRKHLNNPDKAKTPPNHAMSGHVRYVFEGRSFAFKAQVLDWQVMRNEELTQSDMRKQSTLAGLLGLLICFLKTWEDTEIALTQEELLECVLAGRDYDADGTGDVWTASGCAGTIESGLEERRDSVQSQAIDDKKGQSCSLEVADGR